MTLPELPSFHQVFEALWGHAPYPWQARLASQVVSDGAWPQTLGVPTGTGKTATLDIALYALAAEAHLEPTERRAPRRVVMVVDRRTIVDQAHERAQAILDGLLAAEDGPLHAVRLRLQGLLGPDAEHEAPLQVALMRGGVPRDDGWARRPDLPLLAVSTVDQVGSRLLFRGYGIRPTMASVHAGLLGHDTLLLLDEVHLSRPFQQTLDTIGGRYRTWRASTGLPDRWRVVSLSATSGDDQAFDLSDDDLEHPRLRRRLHAPKTLVLRRLDTKTHGRKGPSTKWVKGLVDAALAHERDGRRCIGVVVNRVDTAREVAARLEAARGVRDVQLVTGRMRGHDRALATRDLEHRAGPGWSGRAEEDAAPFVCVATQCIEAGADLDFDGMVTELASLDALVQRFGRVNRTGDHDACPVTVVASKDADPSQPPDPVYGGSLSHAWTWMEGLGEGADLSTSHLRACMASAPADALAPTTDAAVLVPAHLDLLSQTGPVPHPDPEPALYLHGLEPPRPDVSVVWRADLPDPDADGAEEAATAALQAVPPTTHEALSLPFAAARQWLAGEVVGSMSDAGDAGDDSRPFGGRDTVAFVWDGEVARAVSARGLEPGATIVLPSRFGGIHGGTFDPTAQASVADVGDVARTVRSGRVVVRLDPRVHGVAAEDDGSWTWGGLTAPPSTPGPDESVEERRADVEAWIARHAQPDGTLLQRLLSLVGERPVLSVRNGTWVVRGRRPLAHRQLLALARGVAADAASDRADTADDRSVVSTEPVPLDLHLEGVERWAKGLAAACGLPADLVEDVALAGRLHDLGKAHPRFKTLLYGGDPITAAVGVPLAKSGMELADAAARRRARARARLPDGFRHEMESVGMVLGSEAGRALLDQAHDPDLVLHLVASHHGHARPLAPPEDHSGVPTTADTTVRLLGRDLLVPGDHRQDRLDSGVADRFWRLQRRYGWWGLAWLEAILRLADHRESEAESRTNPSGANP